MSFQNDCPWLINTHHVAILQGLTSRESYFGFALLQSGIDATYEPPTSSAANIDQRSLGLICEGQLHSVCLGKLFLLFLDYL